MDERIQELMQRVRRIEIKTKALSDNVFAGEYHSAFKGRGMSFAEVREYQMGDDVRDIDWNVSARFDRTFVKLYEEERELTLMLLVDVSASLDWATRGQSQREMLTEIAATIAFSALRNGDKIGVLFFSDRMEKIIPPAKGKAHVLRIIRELLTITPRSLHTDLGAGLDYFMRAVRRSCVAFLLSDFQDEKDYSQILAVAARRHDLLAVQVYDKLQEALPDVGLIKVEDAETGKVHYLDSSDELLRRSYAQSWQERQAQLLRMLRRLRVEHTLVATDGDFVQALKKLFVRRK